jgi:hypothetical protein
MNLVDLQKQINDSTNTAETLEIVDGYNLSMGTVIVYKANGHTLEIISVAHNYIEGMQYIGTDKWGEQWTVNAKDIAEKYTIKK